jgi:ribulose-phosphate 3-epimerase
MNMADDVKKELPPVRICPSILAADLLRFRDQVRSAEDGGADRFQIDVMDGMFVPNISFGFPLVEAMRRATRLPLEAHLMIARPDRYIDRFAQAGADVIIVHQEAVVHLDRSIKQIKEVGKRAGVALCPATPLHVLEEIIDDVDLVLVMTVNPGFGGQEFIKSSLRKIGGVREMLDARNPCCDLEVDGGIDTETGPMVVAAGANVLVAGTAIFGDMEGVALSVKRLRAAIRNGPGNLNLPGKVI